MNLGSTLLPMLVLWISFEGECEDRRERRVKGDNCGCVGLSEWEDRIPVAWVGWPLVLEPQAPFP